MRNSNLVLAGDLLKCSQNLLDLVWEYIDAFNLHHVIGSAHDNINAWELAAAGASAGDNTGQVMGTIANQRSAFLDQCGNDDLADLAVRQIFAGNRVDDLQVDIVIPVVHSAVFLAADADARSVDLGQSVDIVEFDAQFAGNAVTHLLTPSL